MAFKKSPSIQDTFTQDVTDITKKNRMSKIIYTILGAILLTSLIGGGWWYYTNKIQNNGQVLGANSNATQKSDEDKASDSVSNLKKILLVNVEKDKDGNEVKPAVAKITDKDKVKTSNPEFYKDVENDDTLIIYPTRAVVYREKDNKIINIAPIAPQPAAQTTPTPANAVPTTPVKK
jgi:hypothetical protein